ncbi:putative motility protein [Aliamphritea hakodatensis]|uniref:putative motility protein n=1 Tax=Aliamphritea hakodatensis TaxID=2895352 RepID=UPI0022FD864B|nr:putative motility protein [Aliamphritea hakodatensis]
MELSAASISAYQQQNIQAEVGVEMTAKAIKQIEDEGQMALQLINSTVMPTDPTSSLGQNINVYA